MVQQFPQSSSFSFLQVLYVEQTAWQWTGPCRPKGIMIPPSLTWRWFYYTRVTHGGDLCLLPVLEVPRTRQVFGISHGWCTTVLGPTFYCNMSDNSVRTWCKLVLWSGPLGLAVPKLLLPILLLCPPSRLALKQELLAIYPLSLLVTFRAYYDLVFSSTPQKWCRGSVRGLRVLMMCRVHLAHVIQPKSWSHKDEHKAVPGFLHGAWIWQNLIFVKAPQAEVSRVVLGVIVSMKLFNYWFLVQCHTSPVVHTIGRWRCQCRSLLINSSIHPQGFDNQSTHKQTFPLSFGFPYSLTM